jgi:eukaryotic-like serine/threonine-protein kinase
MRTSYIKWLILGIVILILFFVSVFVVLKNATKPVIVPVVETISSSPKSAVIGKSVEGRDISAFTFGSGNKSLVFVGGIHGGYEWNSVLLAYQLMDYLKANPDLVPENVTVTIIPSLNPDGIYAVTSKTGRFTLADIKPNLVNGTGRFNSRGVDLNRNFDCEWQATSTWKGNVVSAGTSTFSEPEAMAFKSYVLNNKPALVVFWHSQSNGVYASHCKSDILPEALSLLNAYSLASGYPSYKTFDSYVITGAADDWLAKINIPAFSVELKTHETVEWEQNLAGIKALFSFYSSYNN